MQKSPSLLAFALALGLAPLCPACEVAGEAAQPAAAQPPSVAVAAPSQAAAVEAAPAPTVVHTVREGETLWDIARAYGVSQEAIMQANQLRPRDIRKLRKDTPITIPGATRLAQVETKSDRAAQRQALPELDDGAYHFLQRGESLWTLARAYDVPMESLMERNGFDEDVHGQLRIAQPIIIPGITASQIKEAEKAAGGKRRVGFTHEVNRGETVWDIARTFQVSTAEIMAANGLSEAGATNIREGQKLFLPGVEDDGRGRVRRRQSARERRASVVAHRLGLGTLRAAAQLLHGRIAPQWIRAAGPGKQLAGTLKWPVTQGWFVRGFGSGAGGYHKAMDIMGKMGWNVRAAADGIVGYSGDQVPGFGNMIMVVHAGGWVTLYAHNSVNFVVAGERVTKGAVLAEVGSTGRSQGPHVHFELIYEGKNCDPAPLFRPGVRHRTGKFRSVERLVWSRPGKRPKGLACAKRQKHPLAQSVMHENPDADAQSTPGETLTDAPAQE